MGSILFELDIPKGKTREIIQEKLGHDVIPVSWVIEGKRHDGYMTGQDDLFRVSLLCRYYQQKSVVIINNTGFASEFFVNITTERPLGVAMQKDHSFEFSS
jgi:hypothetical protein